MISAILKNIADYRLISVFVMVKGGRVIWIGVSFMLARTGLPFSQPHQRQPEKITVFVEYTILITTTGNLFYQHNHSPAWHVFIKILCF